MAKLDFNRLMQVVLAALTLSLAGGLAVFFLQRSKTEYLTLQIGMEVTKERRSILMSTSAAEWTASAAP